ncbi:palmitoyltransferase ZDHHC23-B isoform X1 [Triplophysa dalaica]|uniref:palmitoyltransferase ZDHHC23-B isoform X1 n=1 Tax=Triplophysa dalaica TaxID=1582913 RepID=UPI0024DFE53D|nr:palmitoyltransferase ZDHHC23-B isoform X1 [Triplophysa dalaica]XP_056594151.1 palmitoyltransferase ZDHHC23-B isoform X1 [Triplophysa dalaica]XP_056594152.1 palmitoyltransferase ZDHHC23-B isoform X1 [Triplophysa dalaica]XP_056594153.1 palmitoyltransferase ZDHHC23-B isoform X1 [Triplophysa dalaica]XP_056594154.1 palmitoyltransferase ZDHHC23-B isoform X1 [Triplophysa dalaica]XP_056594155.1 palmitoyltransferase ZDHHC23-B isoform X1 [Triplophysa dalaica]
MKKQSHKALDQEDPLCCCEYVDRHGRRSHMAACCCDCEDLDDAFDRWIKKEPLKADSLTRLVATINDRLRLPWISGARRFDHSLIPPLILLPVFLHIASWHILLGIIVLTTLPVLVILYYYFTHRKKGRTLFFLSLAVFSLFYMFYLFVAEVVPRGDVNHIQLGAVTTGVALTVISLINTKRGPGYVRPLPTDTHSTVTYHNPPSDIDAAYLNGARHQVVIANRVSAPDRTGESGTASVEPREGQKRDWCSVCKVVRPPRAGHCRICGVCILRLDHHCVWINSCVGQANHSSFLLTLVLFVLTSLYGISLVLRSVCPQQSLIIALFYCPDVYNQYSTALCFTCAWYSSIVTGGLLVLLVLQLINVSYNTTQREVRLALREKTGRTLLWGLIVDTGVYCRGFISNWEEFLTMSNALEPPNPKPTDLV